MIVGTSIAQACDPLSASDYVGECSQGACTQVFELLPLFMEYEMWMEPSMVEPPKPEFSDLRFFGEHIPTESGVFLFERNWDCMGDSAAKQLCNEYRVTKLDQSFDVVFEAAIEEAKLGQQQNDAHIKRFALFATIAFVIVPLCIGFYAEIRYGSETPFYWPIFVAVLQVFAIMYVLLFEFSFCGPDRQNELVILILLIAIVGELLLTGVNLFRYKRRDAVSKGIAI
jgi:hypothetical protein